MAVAVQTSSIAQQKSPIAASITTPTPITKSGAEVRVDVTVTNISDHTVRLYKALGLDGQAEAANHVEVFDSNGKALSRIDGPEIQMRGETRHLPKMWISRKTVPVEPGESSSDFLILSNLFDLSKPGKYTVAVRQEMRSDDSDPDIKLVYATSNTITVTE